MRIKLRVKGIVQGVGFRPFIYRIAVKNDLKGFVRNRGDAGVEILLEGKKDDIKKFMGNLREKKPPLARIHQLVTTSLKEEEKNETFKILKSNKRRSSSGSVVPPDVSICEECLKELRDPHDPRYDYFFITCTNCGPRYTVIENLPYDRDTTTMRHFPMCISCRREYTDPSDRRFHAQTVACSNCGPEVYLTTNKGERIEIKDPVREGGRLLSEGFILAIKGYGGFHLASATTQDKPLKKLRREKHRRQKPFAIMAPNLKTTRSFAEVSKKEAQLLTSFRRPIVLLNKGEGYYLSNLIAPKLHNIGVMLPYTGLHYMLFDEVEDPAFVMTSANPPNQPIIKENSTALEKLGSIVDYFLFHDREIAYRCDDSVARVHNNQHISLIRRSRGYAPTPINLHIPTRKCALGLGGEQNVVSCILDKKKGFLSSHIGDVTNIETMNFLEKTTKHLIDLTNSDIEIISCDLHPKFSTTILASKLAEEFNCPVLRVQHHHAHVAGLRIENGLNEIIGIICDGYGYGPNDEAWGGEIMYSNPQNQVRIGHLEEQPMPGGDLATRYPIRMAAGILQKTIEIEDWLISKSSLLPYGRQEANLILDQLKKGVKFKTSSCGRILDAVSALLGICYERTYEGEPAMKLEAIAKGGEDILNLKPRINGDIINTTDMVVNVFQNVKRFKSRDLAFSAQNYMAKSLGELAVKKASELNVANIGFSGGVAYNEHIAVTLQEIVERNDLNFFVHQQAPAGDGGVSFGQATMAGFEIDQNI